MWPRNRQRQITGEASDAELRSLEPTYLSDRTVKKMIFAPVRYRTYDQKSVVIRLPCGSGAAGDLVDCPTETNAAPIRTPSQLRNYRT
jgi:hypothetical protein